MLNIISGRFVLLTLWKETLWRSSYSITLLHFCSNDLHTDGLIKNTHHHFVTILSAYCHVLTSKDKACWKSFLLFFEFWKVISFTEWSSVCVCDLQPDSFLFYYHEHTHTHSLFWLIHIILLLQILTTTPNVDSWKQQLYTNIPFLSVCDIKISEQLSQEISLLKKETMYLWGVFKDLSFELSATDRGRKSESFKTQTHTQTQWQIKLRTCNNWHEWK